MHSDVSWRTQYGRCDVIGIRDDWALRATTILYSEEFDHYLYVQKLFYVAFIASHV